MIEKVKDSGIEWIGEIPEEWEVSKLKYVVYFINGDRGSNYPSGDDMVDEGVIFVTSNNIHNTILDSRTEISKYITEERYKLLGGAKIELNDIIFCLRGSIGICAINKSIKAGTIASSLVDIKPYKINADFLNYLLHAETSSYQTSLFMNGSCAANLSAENVANYYFISPPLSEQCQIADFLDKKVGQVDDILVDLNKQVEILNQYKKSLITETVTKGLNPNAEMKDSGIDWIGEIPKEWEIKPLKYLGVARNGLTYSPDDQVDEDEGILVMRSSNIQDGKISLDDNVYVKMKIPENLILSETDLLICSRNGSRNLIGKNALITKENAGQTYGAFMCVYRSKYNEYIHYVLNSDIFTYYLSTFLTSTINQLTNGNLYSIKIPFPLDKMEQKQIVDYLDKKCTQIDELIADKQAQIEKMENYKKSLIYEYVTGKKRVGV